MTPTRVALALLLLLLALAAGLGAWAYASRGYANTVYSMRFRFTSFGSGTFPPVADQRRLYIDPQGQAMRAEIVGSPAHSYWLWIRGAFYPVGTSGYAVPLTLSALGDEADTYRDVQLKGIAGLGLVLLAHRSGRMNRLLDNGRPALRFAATGAGVLSLFSPTPSAVWLDAHTLVPIEVQAWNPDGSYSTLLVIQTQRLAPNTLPADFFDPPARQQGLWHRVLGWVRDRMARP